MSLVKRLSWLHQGQKAPSFPGGAKGPLNLWDGSGRPCALIRGYARRFTMARHTTNSSRTAICVSTMVPPGLRPHT